MGYFSYYCVDMVRDGILFPDYTIGLIPIPKWIPQVGMTIGVVLLFIVLCRRPGLHPEGRHIPPTTRRSGQPEDRHTAYE